MNLLRYYIYYVLLHFTLTGSSFIQIGDAISVHVDSSVSYKHTSNILKTAANQISDGLYVITPGVLMNFGKNETPLDLSFRAKYEMLHYNDYGNLDVNLSQIYFDGSYNPSEIFNSRFSFSSLRSTKSDLSVPTIIVSIDKTTSEFASYLASYRFSPKSSVSIEVQQSELDYDLAVDRMRLSSKESTHLPFKLIYHYSDKLNVLYGVTFSNNKIGDRIRTVNVENDQGQLVPINFFQQAYETDSVYYNIGLSGNILPKLTGNLDFGYRSLSFSDATIDYNAFGASSKLTWMTYPKLRTSIFFSHDFDSSGDGGTYKSTMANFNALYSISTDYKLSVEFGRILKKYRENSIRRINAREDALTNFSLNLLYYPTVNYSFAAGYSYSKGDFDDAIMDDYDSKQFRLTANLKY